MGGPGLSDAADAGVRVRDAALSDAPLLLTWANDAETRRQSFSHQVISLEQHLDWLRGILADERRTIYIAERGPESVGTVRFERADDVDVISVTVAPEHRGRGLAASILAAGVARWRDAHPGSCIRAEIRAGNEASIRAFRRAGFREAASVTDDRGEVRIMELDAPV